MLEEPSPPTLWHCASCDRDFVSAIPQSLAHGVSSLIDPGMVKHCLFCGKSELRPYGPTSPDNLFWL